MSTMKAVALKAHGGPEQLEVVDVPVPEPGPGQVRVKVAAAALNRLDLFTMEGIPGLELPMPHIVASDVAGTVDAVGEDVPDWSPGDRVAVNPGLYDGSCEFCKAGQESLCVRYAILGEHVPGAMAEFVVVPASNLVRVPDGFPFIKAAAANLVYQTAWRMAVTRGGLKEGDTCLVLGAGSGLSTALIQIAKHLGATVYATTSTPEKMALARAIGADHVYNYREDNWSKEVFLATRKRGVDVVFDSVGKETLNASVRTVRRGGKVVVPGGTTGQDVELNLRYLYWKQVDLLGSTMGSQAEYETVMDLVFQGKLVPEVSHEFSYRDGREAYETLVRGEQFGKIVVRFS